MSTDCSAVFARSMAADHFDLHQARPVMLIPKAFPLEAQHLRHPYRPILSSIPFILLEHVHMVKVQWADLDSAGVSRRPVPAHALNHILSFPLLSVNLKVMTGHEQRPNIPGQHQQRHGTWTLIRGRVRARPLHGIYRPCFSCSRASESDRETARLEPETSPARARKYLTELAPSLHDSGSRFQATAAAAARLQRISYALVSIPYVEPRRTRIWDRTRSCSFPQISTAWINLTGQTFPAGRGGHLMCMHGRYLRSQFHCIHIDGNPARHKSEWAAGFSGTQHKSAQQVLDVVLLDRTSLSWSLGADPAGAAEGARVVQLRICHAERFVIVRETECKRPNRMELDSQSSAAHLNLQPLLLRRRMPRHASHLHFDAWPGRQGEYSTCPPSLASYPR
nr:hypothetical protein CFP56_01337 [Quercus suber]